MKQQTKSTAEIEESYQDQVSSIVKKYIDTCDDPRRIPCSSAVLYLLGHNSYMAEDEIPCMKATMVDLLVFLADPEVSLQFQKTRTPWSDEYANHLGRMIKFFDDIDNVQAEAELHYRAMEEGQIDEKHLQEWEKEYKEKINHQALSE